MKNPFIMISFSGKVVRNSARSEYSSVRYSAQ
ncbi:hypothetical protein Vch1786_I1462 [Vibrio cholerae O1 str. 2010EL-1786]|uniref:Uncharacterized protein n=2 Tax=Vibrio cholerae TaxID=666 RepID=Q9KQM9_VIBCH|nr:hypothetical protein VC_1969 [Vibrio cholerae O1 biovar El Tor str. N16961]ACP06196.1 conserved hypothetical protein [Vibrio cholerae M66-2]ACP10076.1 conserved hypothetical protein [Vibrio cholerae O395]AET27062.1 hypothetical protein Vch1786_I1462 [Vibrio cholerae O1 str. 2010EL-1786]CSC06275.1 Uncharacterised protein [Vibrio cholerae]